MTAIKLETTEKDGESLKGRLGGSCLDAPCVKTMVCGPGGPLCAPSQYGLATSGGVCMLSHISLSPRTEARQAPLPMGFPRQAY